MIILGKKAKKLKTEIMGVQISADSRQQLLSVAMDLIKTGGLIVTPNAEMLYLARRDAAFRGILNSADIALPDGAGTVLAGKILKRPPLTKIAGVEFALELCQLLAKENRSLYILGGKPGVAEKAGDNLARRFSGLRICGTAHGFYESQTEALAAVKAAKPDCVFVCLGFPLQEAVASQLDGTLALCLGGSADIYAGNSRRAPSWMIRLNLEWLYRLLQDPKRWKRMLTLPLFVAECFLERRRNHGKTHSD